MTAAQSSETRQRERGIIDRIDPSLFAALQTLRHEAEQRSTTELMQLEAIFEYRRTAQSLY